MKKNKIIEIVKNEYQKQVDLINNKYSQILEENAYSSARISFL